MLLCTLHVPEASGKNIYKQTQDLRSLKQHSVLIYWYSRGLDEEFLSLLQITLQTFYLNFQLDVLEHKNESICRELRGPHMGKLMSLYRLLLLGTANKVSLG